MFSPGGKSIVVRGIPIACILLAGIVVLAQAAPIQGWLSHWKVVDSSNDFFTGGSPLNGALVVTSPPLTGPPFTGLRSGYDPAGYLARAHKSNPSFGLGDFNFDPNNFPMTEARHGAGTVIARGPDGMEEAAQLGPPRDTVSYLYVVGGMEQGTVSGTIERAEIDADGNIFPGLEAQAGQLATPRYGAAVVARGDSIYVIGGYGGNDQPVQSIERFQIDRWGYLDDPEIMTSPGWGGDVAAVILNGYLYVMGGSDSPRGPVEDVQPWIQRSPISPLGNLGPFEEIHTEAQPTATLYMPVGVAGGRAVVVAGWESNQPVYSIYYIGGNVGNTVNGASRNVYRLKVKSDNTVPDGWTSVMQGTDLVQLVDPRELFAAVVTNGYLYVIGGETTMQGLTTYYSLVERAAVSADGTIGQFTRLDGMNSTYINGYDRASDINGAVLNNHIYVPGGRDAWGNALNQIFELSLDQGGNSLLSDPAPDTSVFNLVSDLGQNRDIRSIVFKLGPDKAGAGGIRVRFRTAQYGEAWGAWTPYFKPASLPPEYLPSNPVAGEVPVLLDLSYTPNKPLCLDVNTVPNPTNKTGPVTARYVEYEVIIPEGSADQRFHGITLNSRPIARFALPGGYDPLHAGGPYPPSCAPSNAIADMGVQNGWLRFEGVGFEDPDFLLNANTIKFLPQGMITATSVLTDSNTLDVKVNIGSGSGPLTYALVYQADPNADPVTLLENAVKVFPAPTLEHDTITPGLDVHPGNSTARENVVEAPTPQAVKAKFTTSLFGTNFRSGRVKDTGATAVDDPTGSGTWPSNPYDPNQVSVIRYQVVDQTPTTGGFEPLKLWNMSLGAWKDVAGSEFGGPTNFKFDLEVNNKAKSGPHDLLITVQNPQLGRTIMVTQTVYVVPAFDVTKFQTRLDPTPDPFPGAGNRYNWTGSNNPAVADLGDGTGFKPLWIDVEGYGFQSDTGSDLILTTGVAPVLNSYAPSPGNPHVVDPLKLNFTMRVPSNTIPRLHYFTIDWAYELGVSDLPGHVQPVWDGPTNVTRTWTPQSGSWVGLYVVPPRVHIQSILGSHNTSDPIMVVQSDPVLTVNGDGFATHGPYDGGYVSTIHGARLISMANSPDEDIHPMPGEMHMVSDCQARLTMAVTGNERPGETYMLEMTTHLPDLEADPNALASSKVRTPYSVDQAASAMVTVLPLPVCTSVAPSCFRTDQGTTLSHVVVTGRNFDQGTTVDLGPGITIQNLQVCHDNAACPTQDTLTFDAVVSALAAPGSRLVQIDNGPTSGMSLMTSCDTEFWVVPKPAISLVQPSEIQQPPMAPGVKTVPIDVYGTNFVQNPVLQVIGTGDVNVKSGTTTLVDSGHITAELIVNRAVAEGSYTLRLTEPAGPTCGTATMVANGSFRITPFRELSISTVSSTGTGCQGRSGTMAVTGTNFRDPSGGDLVGSASLGPDVSVDSMVINSATSLTIAYSISDGAGLGQKSLVLEPVTAGATPATWPNALNVTSSPSIISVSPASIPGGTSRQVTISGRNFQTGATVTIAPNAGLTHTWTVDNAGQISGTVTAVQNVGPELRTITVTNPGTGQCSVATMMDAFRVIPKTSITVVSNDMTQCQGRSGSLTVTGVNFKDPSGASLVGSVSLGADVSIDSMLVSSATQMTVGYTINDGATLGMRSLTVNSNVQGAAPASWSDALMVTSSPSITSVSPRSMQIGDTNRQISITGRNFTVSGVAIGVTPSTGMTISNVSVVNSGLILANVTIDGGVQPDARTITVTNSDGGQCAVATLSAAIQIVDPPHVTSTKLMMDQHKLRIFGTNFHPSMQAYVGGSATPWPRINVNSNSTVTLIWKKARAFKRTFPKHTPVEVRLVNPDDGGEVTITVTRGGPLS